MNKLKQALKDDFKKLYQPQFTTTWEAERLVRETEIDVMELQAIEAYIAEQTRLARIDEIKKLGVGRPNSNRNKNDERWMSGFGYAANNLQDIKTQRLDHLSKKGKKE